MSDKNMMIGIVALLVVVAVFLFLTGKSPTPLAADDTTATTTKEATGPNLPLAQCLKDSGAVFYGAFWCPHCQAQEKLFGEAAPALPYVECSTPDKRDQTQICKDKGITGYPTWIMPDGTQLSGEQSFQTLAEKTNCTDFLLEQPTASGPVNPSSL